MTGIGTFERCRDVRVQSVMRRKANITRRMIECVAAGVVSSSSGAAVEGKQTVKKSFRISATVFAIRYQ
jgi:hypothetical protein